MIQLKTGGETGRAKRVPGTACVYFVAVEPGTSFETTDQGLREFNEAFQSIYLRRGYTPPWTGYFAIESGEVVGCCGFKGPPLSGKVEISYVTATSHRNRGIGSQMCKRLLKIAEERCPSVIVSARTLKEPNTSVRILQHAGFAHMGEVLDEEDGWVWEWTWNSKQ